jgi:hypothetical protein
LLCPEQSFAAQICDLSIEGVLQSLPVNPHSITEIASVSILRGKKGITIYGLDARN